MNLHFKDGGTGLTNFERRELPIYEKAIRMEGSGNYWIVKAPFDDTARHFENGSACSLHRAGHINETSEFWGIFDWVKNNS